MNFSEAARQSGLTTKTLRHYESAGLIQPPPGEPNGYRNYRAMQKTLRELADRCAGDEGPDCAF